jgi:hypothetical protein
MPINYLRISSWNRGAAWPIRQTRAVTGTHSAYIVQRALGDAVVPAAARTFTVFSGVPAMGRQSPISREREEHLKRLQQALTEGLQAINRARTASEAEAARLKARARLKALSRAIPPVSGEPDR